MDVSGRGVRARQSRDDVCAVRLGGEVHEHPGAVESASAVGLEEPQPVVGEQRKHRERARTRSTRKEGSSADGMIVRISDVHYCCCESTGQLESPRDHPLSRRGTVQRRDREVWGRVIENGWGEGPGGSALT